MHTDRERILQGHDTDISTRLTLDLGRRFFFDCTIQQTWASQKSLHRLKGNNFFLIQLKYMNITKNVVSARYGGWWHFINDEHQPTMKEYISINQVSGDGTNDTFSVDREGMFLNTV